MMIINLTYDEVRTERGARRRQARRCTFTHLSQRSFGPEVVSCTMGTVLLKAIVKETTKTTRTAMSAIRLSADNSQIKRNSTSIPRANKLVDRESWSGRRDRWKIGRVLVLGACLGRAITEQTNDCIGGVVALVDKREWVLSADWLLITWECHANFGRKERHVSPDRCIQVNDKFSRPRKM